MSGCADGLRPGDEVEVEVTAVAHGGHCVARHEGRVLFVRHAIPGERVRVRVTDGGPGDRFLRADAVAVLDASPDRVPAPCPYAGPGRCGGCDFQHVSLERQRAIKAEVLHEQLTRLGHLDRDVVVEPLPVPGRPDDGLGWRTRVEYAVDPTGRPGLRPHRSHDVLPIEQCLIASGPVRDADVLDREWPGERAVDVVAPSAGDVLAVPVPSGSATTPAVSEVVRAGEWVARFEVPARGFWQVHPSAAATFVDAVLAMLDPREGEDAIDLYAGVGLFAAAVAERVGPTGRVLAVESDRMAVLAAGANLAPWPWAAMLGARVDDAFGVARPTRRGPADRRARRPRPLRRHPDLPQRADLVVLDPPRTGAGRRVLEGVAALGPRAIAYVACDPAALARDTAYLARIGYGMSGLRAFDAFPMTHHSEAIASFTPRS